MSSTFRFYVKASFLFFLISMAAPLYAQLIYPGDVDILGAEEIVFDWAADSCEQIDIPDAPARFFRDADGKIQLIAPHYTNYRMIGDDFNSLVRDCANGPIMTSHKNHDPAKWDDHEWIVSTYTTDGKTIHAIIHNEFHGAANTDFVSCPSGDYMKCWYNGLTYATSTDTGRTYTHAVAPGHFVATIPYPYEPDVGPSGIFGGSNIVYNPGDGYYYNLLHLEARGLQEVGVGLMRTQDLSDPTSWRAWDGTGFTVQFIDPENNTGFDPADHIAAPIATNGALAKMTMNLTWNTYFNKWMIVGATAKGSTWGIYYSVSEDLIHWTVRKKIMAANLLINPKHSNAEDIIAYPTIVDHADTSRNFEITGREAYLYFTRWHITEGTYDRDLVRIPIRFNKLEVYGFEITGTGNQQDADMGDGICKTSSGLCSFRAALEESNNRPPWYADSTYNITFNIPQSGLQILNLSSSVPSSYYSVNINGFTQPGSSPNTAPFGEPINTQYGIALNFSGANGITFEASHNTLKGLAIYGQQGDALHFYHSDSNVVQGMFLNVSGDGLTNMTSANDGVRLESSSYNLIGDTTAAGRNLILGGVRIKGPDAAYNRIEGNYIGTDLNGTTKLDQWAAGVTIQDAAQYNTIGGANIKARNLLSGNNSQGVQIEGAGTSDNQVLNNYIGVTADGSGKVGNGNGATISMGAEGNYFGRPGYGNVVSGNNDIGIWVDQGPRNFIQGNFIGTDTSGTLDLGNGGAGMWIKDNANQLAIGGAGAGEANTIANNKDGGIMLFGDAGTGIKIWSNSIYNNANGLGIDLGFDDSVNGNDDQDTDTGVNNFQNAPELTSAIAGEVQINGTLNSTPNTVFRIEFFVSDTCDPSGYGEGQTYLDAMEVTTDASGNAVINTTLTKTVEAGKFISATASDPAWNTSEFSNCVRAGINEGVLAVNTSSIETSAEIEESTTFDLTIENSGNLVTYWTLSWNASWLSASATMNTIQPLTSENIVLTFSATALTAQIYVDTLTLSNSNGIQAAIKIPVQFTVTKTPKIAASVDSIKTQTVTGNQVAESFSISNSGHGILTWSSETPADKTWLSAMPKSGQLAVGESQQIDVQLMAASLSPGIYNAEVSINSNDSTNTPLIIPVVFTVIGPGPAADLQPRSISETLLSGDSLKVSVTLSSVGTETLTWSMSTPVSWIVPVASSGSVAVSQQETLYFWLKTAGLSAETHRDTVSIATNDPSHPTFDIPVELHVNQSYASLSINSDNFSTTVSLGDSITMPLIIGNQGSGALNWNLSWNAGWLSASPQSGTVAPGASDTVSIMVNSTGLGIEAVVDTMQLVTNASNFPLVKIAVRMQTTQETPQISVSQDNLSSTLDPGDTTSHPISILNNGNAALQWSLSWNASWVYPTVSSGSLAPGQSIDFFIVYKTEGVAPGAYLDSMYVLSNDPTTPSFLVKAYMTINEKYPQMFVSQDNLGSRLKQGETMEHWVIISNWGNGLLTWNATKNEPWVQPDHLEGSVQPGKDDTMRVVLSAIDMQVGSFSDTLTITSNDANNDLWKVAISLIVEQGSGGGNAPEIVVSPDTLRAEVARGSNVTRDLSIQNIGVGPLNYTLKTAFFARWVVVDMSNQTLPPGQTTTKLVQLMTDTLALGEHEGVVMVQSNDADEPNIVIPVYVNVIESVSGGRIDVSPNNIIAKAPVAGKITRKLMIKSVGTSEVQWLVQEQQDYLAAQPVSGSTPPGQSQEVLLNFDAAGLAVGVYSDTIHVLQTSEPPMIFLIPFTFTVAGLPDVSLDHDSIFVTIDEGATFSEELTLWNLGDAELEWQIELRDTTSDWLAFDPQTGTIASGDSAKIQIDVDATALSGGTKTGARIVIKSNDPQKPEIEIWINVEVRATVGVQIFSGLPEEFMLSQNFPNPFNPATVIYYALPEQAWVSLKIYNISGRQVYNAVDQLQSASQYRIKWRGITDDGQPVAAGVYLYKLTAHGVSGRVFVQTRKMMFLK